MGILHDVMKNPRTTLKRYRELGIRDAEYGEIFVEQPYHWLAMKLKPDTVLFDFGANIGGSSIYFAQFREVRKVMAYEPFPYTYAQMLGYLKRCPLSERIESHNEAIDSERHSFRASISEIPSNATPIEGMRARDGKRVQAITLNDAIGRYRNVAIKCDIEGGEGRIFANADLSEVYAIMLEWHGKGAQEGATKALSASGFKMESGGERPDRKLGRIGYLKAWRD